MYIYIYIYKKSARERGRENTRNSERAHQTEPTPMRATARPNPHMSLRTAKVVHGANLIFNEAKDAFSSDEK